MAFYSYAFKATGYTQCGTFEIASKVGRGFYSIEHDRLEGRKGKGADYHLSVSNTKPEEFSDTEWGAVNIAMTQLTEEASAKFGLDGHIKVYVEKDQQTMQFLDEVITPN